MRYARSMRFLFFLPFLVFACLLRPAWAAPPTPVEYGIAVETGNVRAVQAWLDEGLPPDYEADRIGSGLMIAAWNGHLELMRLFLDRGANINFANRFDEQALQLAAWRGHADAVHLLLERGAAINRAGNHWGALHYAVFAGHDDIARLLMAQGADVNARAPNASTALMLAAREDRADLAQALIDAGADASMTNEWGDDALAFAMRNGNYRIAKMVSSAETFAQAVKQPEVFGEAKKSVPAPSEIAGILEKIRQAQAAGKPTGALRKALDAAITRHHHDSKIQVLKTRKGKNGKPEVLVITADRNRAGRERAELIHEATKAGAAVSTPAEMSKRASGSSEIAGILDQLQRKKGDKHAEAELRRALRESVTRFKREAQAGR